jgi:hypothetical protein
MRLVAHINASLFIFANGEARPAGVNRCNGGSGRLSGTVHPLVSARVPKSPLTALRHVRRLPIGGPPCAIAGRPLFVQCVGRSRAGGASDRVAPAPSAVIERLCCGAQAATAAVAQITRDEGSY